MATSLSGDEVIDSESSGLPWIAKVSSLPPTLTLRGKSILLKTPTPQDDAVMRQILSDPLTVQYLPHFHRSEGWTLDEMVSRRVKLDEARAEDLERLRKPGWMGILFPQDLERLKKTGLDVHSISAGPWTTKKTGLVCIQFVQGQGLTVFIHLLGNKKINGNEDSRTGPDEGEDDRILVGTTGFRSINLQCGTGEIGIILHHLYWRKGIATEALYLCLRYAFDSLGLQRVDWFTSVENKDMRGWCEDLLKMKPFDIMIDDLGASVGYSLSQSEWQSRISQYLEQRVTSRKELT